jgi:hypothetical protein
MLTQAMVGSNPSVGQYRPAATGAKAPVSQWQGNSPSMFNSKAFGYQQGAPNQGNGFSGWLGRMFAGAGGQWGMNSGWGSGAYAGGYDPQSAGIDKYMAGQPMNKAEFNSLPRGGDNLSASRNGDMMVMSQVYNKLLGGGQQPVARPQGRPWYMSPGFLGAVAAFGGAIGAGNPTAERLSVLGQSLAANQGYADSLAMSRGESPDPKWSSIGMSPREQDSVIAQGDAKSAQDIQRAGMLMNALKTNKELQAPDDYVKHEWDKEGLQAQQDFTLRRDQNNLNAQQEQFKAEASLRKQLLIDEMTGRRNQPMQFERAGVIFDPATKQWTTPPANIAPRFMEQGENSIKGPTANTIIEGLLAGNVPQTQMDQILEKTASFDVGSAIGAIANYVKEPEKRKKIADRLRKAAPSIWHSQEELAAAEVLAESIEGDQPMKDQAQAHKQEKPAQPEWAKYLSGGK